RDTWMVSGRLVAPSGAVTTRLQPACFDTALKASSTVPRGWSMEMAGALSGSRPSSLWLSEAAAWARPGRNTRMTRPTTNFAALISALPSSGEYVRARDLFRRCEDSRPGNEPQREQRAGRRQDDRRPGERRHQREDDSDTGRPSGDVGDGLRGPH